MSKVDIENSANSFVDDNVQKIEISGIHQKLLNILSRGSYFQKEKIDTTLLDECIAELLGTMMIVIFGVGMVCSSVLTSSTVGLWQVTVVWGFGVALAIICTASVSGAHLNPAVSLAMAIFRPVEFPFRKLLPFWLAQYLGGILGGAFNLMAFSPIYDYFESQKDISRGSVESIVTASTFGEYFPAPGSNLPNSVISPGFAMLIEAWGTGILVFVILALTDPRQKMVKNKEMIPFYIGFTVAVLMTLYVPITMGGFNPARDFGPRIIAAIAGWGKVAIPGPRNGFWVYIVGPKLGALFGSLIYDSLIRPGLTFGF